MENIENEFCKMWREDGIIFIDYLSENIDDNMVDFLIKTKMKLADGRWYPMLSDISHVKSFSRAARERFSKKDAGEYTSAAAILVSSKVQVLIYNFFNSIYKAPSPAKLFHYTQKEEALAWLQKYKKDSTAES